jgi:hypothetical protein
VTARSAAGTSINDATRRFPTDLPSFAPTIDVVVEFEVPLIRGTIADLVAGDTRRALGHEQSWMNEHLES